MLDIATDQEGHHRIYVINLRGRIDSITARDFEEFFEDMLKTGNRFFILDASRLDFVSSSGIAALVKFIRRLDAVGGATAVIRLNPEIRMLLEFFGLEEGLPEFERLEDARGYLSEKMRANPHSLEIGKERVMTPMASDEERRQALRAREAKFEKAQETYARPLYSDEENPADAGEEPAEYDGERPAPRLLKLHRPGTGASRPRQREERPSGYEEEDEPEAYEPDPARAPARRSAHPKKYYVQGELDVEELRSRVEQRRSSGTGRRPTREEEQLREEALREYRPLREKEGRHWTGSPAGRSEPRKKPASPRPQLYYREASFEQGQARPSGLSAPSLRPPEIHHKPAERERRPLQTRMRQADVIHRETPSGSRAVELVEFAEPRVLVCESCGTHLRVYHSGRHLCANTKCRIEFRVSTDGSVSYFEKLKKS